MKNSSFEWGLGASFVALCGAGLVSLTVDARASDAATFNAGAEDPRLALTALYKAATPDIGLREIREASVRRNETLSGLLDRVGAPRFDANDAVHAVSDLVDLRRILPGQDVRIWLEPGDEGDEADVRLAGMSLRPDSDRQVLVFRTSGGDWSAQELTAKLSASHHKVSGAIEDSIYSAALAQGARDQQVVDFASIFAYDIDFQRDPRVGDEFEILYETFADERGNPVRNGDVLFAAYHGSALKKNFYRFTPSDDGVTDFFDDEGQSARKFLMKTPINGARLSSHFGNRRHPVLGYNKLHKGTDFAAPRGTPIYAAGNGVIERAGPFSTYGNYIRIRHANGYQTAYAHMNGFAKGMRKGRRVRQGEIIGYVGTTGRSTGPHLHYEVHFNGNPVNAMRLKLPTGRKLEGDQLEAFLAERQRIDQMRAEQAGPKALPVPSMDLPIAISASQDVLAIDPDEISSFAN